MKKDKELENDVEHLPRGELSRKYSSEYDSWKNMKSRRRSHGAIINPEFEDFGSFLSLMGQKASRDLTIDRLDPHDPEYSAAKCAWVSKTQQSSNQKRTLKLQYKGETRPLVEWCREFDLKPDTVRRRFHKGGSAEEILFGVKGSRQENPWAAPFRDVQDVWPWLGPKNAQRWEQHFRDEHHHLETRYEFFAELIQKEIDNTENTLDMFQEYVDAFDIGQHRTLEMVDFLNQCDMHHEEALEAFENAEEHLEILLEVRVKFDSFRTKDGFFHHPAALRQDKRSKS